jgi:hypothetical protein
MSDIDEVDEYSEEEYDEDVEVDKIETEVSEKKDEDIEEDIDEDEKEEEDVNEEEDDSEEIENVTFNEKAKIKEYEEEDESIKKIIEHKTKRIHEIKYFEFVSLLSKRYATLSRGGNSLVSPVKDDIDETIFKEILEGKSPMLIEKNNILVPLKPDRAILYYIDNIKLLLNL